MISDRRRRALAHQLTDVISFQQAARYELISRGGFEVSNICSWLERKRKLKQDWKGVVCSRDKKA